MKPFFIFYFLLSMTPFLFSEEIYTTINTDKKGWVFSLQAGSNDVETDITQNNPNNSTHHINSSGSLVELGTGYYLVNWFLIGVGVGFDNTKGQSTQENNSSIDHDLNYENILINLHTKFSLSKWDFLKPFYILVGISNHIIEEKHKVTFKNQSTFMPPYANQDHHTHYNVVGAKLGLGFELWLNKYWFIDLGLQARFYDIDHYKNFFDYNVITTPLRNPSPPDPATSNELSSLQSRALSVYACISYALY